MTQGRAMMCDGLSRLCGLCAPAHIETARREHCSVGLVTEPDWHAPDGRTSLLFTNAIAAGEVQDEFVAFMMACRHSKSFTLPHLTSKELGSGAN